MRINNHPLQSYLTETTQDKNKTHESDTRQNFPGAQDSVSISAEAFARAKELYVQNKTELAKDMEGNKNALDPNVANPNAQSTKKTVSLSDLYSSYLLFFGDSEEDDDKSTSASASASENTSSASLKDNIQKQIDALEKQIEKLQGKIIQIASSDAPEVVKESQISALEGQIAALSSQKAALQATLTKMDVTSKNSTSTIFSK